MWPVGLCVRASPGQKKKIGRRLVHDHLPLFFCCCTFSSLSPQYFLLSLSPVSSRHNNHHAQPARTRSYLPQNLLRGVWRVLADSRGQVSVGAGRLGSPTRKIRESA